MKPASTQTDKGLGFDGAEQVSRRDTSSKFAGNQHGGKAGGNYGRGPTKGNTGTRATPGTAAMPASVKIKDPDYINGGAQVRTPGGTRSFEPSKTQNFKGNSDRINAGPGPRKGNQQ